MLKSASKDRALYLTPRRNIVWMGGCRVWVGDLLTVTTTKATSCATSSRMLFVSFFLLHISIKSYMYQPLQSPSADPLWPVEQTQTVGAVVEHSMCVVVVSPQSVVAVPAVHVWPIFNAGIAVMGQ